MRIIKMPSDPQYGGEFKCKCGAVLEYSSDDIRHNRHEPDSAHVVCPFCNNKLYLYSDI